jgi:hypothetical protein
MLMKMWSPSNEIAPVFPTLRVRQVAAQFGVCTATVYKWAADGGLATRLGSGHQGR